MAATPAPDPGLACRIAQCALDHYHRVLPSNNGGKPQGGREWTVYAAIVARRDRSGAGKECEDGMWVVSCATGSKCASLRSMVSTLPSSTLAPSNEERRKRRKKLDPEAIVKCYNGLVVKDSHAEVLARRGLLACLWEEVETSLRRMAESDKPCRARRLLEASGSTTFRLRRGITLHLYISDSPCGDATIYEIRRHWTRQWQEDQAQSGISREPKGGDTELNFTGAKIILPRNHRRRAGANEPLSSILACPIVQQTDSGNPKQSVIALGRENTQQLGALRLKSSRSNMPSALRSTSMCCSDKLVRWGVMGLQGRLLARYIPGPICLASICVSRDPRSVGTGGGSSQLVALERAVTRRIESALKSAPRTQETKLTPPEVAVVEHVFECSKSAVENMHHMHSAAHRNRERDCPASNKQQHPSNKLCGAGHGHRKEHSSGQESRHPPPASSARQSTKNKAPSACGMSLNWHQTDRMEITIGGTGLKRGKRPRTPEDVLASASRLCRYCLFQRWKTCAGIEAAATSSDSAEGSGEVDKLGYMEYKRHSQCTGDAFQGPLQGWVRSGQEDNFVPP